MVLFVDPSCSLWITVPAQIVPATTIKGFRDFGAAKYPLLLKATIFLIFILRCGYKMRVIFEYGYYLRGYGILFSVYIAWDPMGPLNISRCMSVSVTVCLEYVSLLH